MKPEEALARWQRREPLRPAPDGGLINQTWLVGQRGAGAPQAVLQWVNPIFDPRIHLDIAALTERLAAAGVATPLLLPTPDGQLYVADGKAGCWRLLTYLPGRTFHRLSGADQARQAGALVGRFHAALAGWKHRFQASRRNVHDTLARMSELRVALEEAGEHPLAGAARQVGTAILERWVRWDGELNLPLRPCHGDLKVSNLRFDAPTGLRATGILDLDTIGPLEFACELGDAWRSWCNPAGEDDPARCRFDIALFTASARAWLAYAPPLSDAERRSLVPGIERITLELAARFCTDAVRNVYFQEDRRRFPQPGAHNLLRARCQLALARSARAQRAECEAVLTEEE